MLHLVVVSIAIRDVVTLVKNQELASKFVMKMNVTVKMDFIWMRTLINASNLRIVVSN